MEISNFSLWSWNFLHLLCNNWRAIWYNVRYERKMSFCRSKDVLWYSRVLWLLLLLDISFFIKVLRRVRSFGFTVHILCSHLKSLSSMVKEFCFLFLFIAYKSPQHPWLSCVHTHTHTHKHTKLLQLPTWHCFCQGFSVPK